MYTVLQQDFRKFDQLDLLARQVVEGFIIGLHKSPYHGFSVEFAEHRLYNQGDTIRNVDWKVYGRTGKMYTKKYEEETNLRCQLVIDVSSSMRFPLQATKGQLNKLEFSAVASAALMYMLKKQRDAAGLTLIGKDIKVHTLCKTNQQHHQLMMNYLYQELIQTNTLEKTALAENLHKVAEMVHQRSLVIIFSDMLTDGGDPEALFSALQHLRHNKHEVVLFHVVDKAAELDFKFDNRPYEFVDLETGQSVKLLPAEVRDRYRKMAEATESAIKLKCAQYKIDVVETDIAKGYDDILQAYLLKRSRMKI